MAAPLPDAREPAVHGEQRRADGADELRVRAHVFPWLTARPAGQECFLLSSPRATGPVFSEYVFLQARI